MSLFTKYLSNLEGKGEVTLPQEKGGDHLETKEGMSNTVEKCEVRIEGMTCGACVEVCRKIYVSLILLTLVI